MIADLGNKMQVCTQRYGKRPYGVGLLVAGYDDQGPHIFQTCPSSNYYGMASFMYLRAIFCTFQISVDFYFVPVSGRGGLEKGRGLERGG